MQAPAIPPNEPERQQALEGYRILDTPPEAAFSRLTLLGRQIFSVPICYISLIDQQRQWFKTADGLELCETSRDSSFCGHTILYSTPLVVLNTATDSRFADNPFVVGPPHIRFYAGAPLITPDSLHIGTFCIVDNEPRSTFSDLQREQLVLLAQIAMGQIEATRTAKDAMEAEAALRENQIRWELVLQGNNEGIWDWDVQSDTVFHSHRWKEILGYKDEELPNEVSVWKSLLHPADLPNVLEILNRYLRREAAGYAPEYRMRAKDGHYVWILARGQALWDASGKPVRMVGSHTDISRRKRLEEQVLQSNRELEDRNRELQAAIEARTELLSRMSHEFRTPLNAIIGFGQLLLELTEVSPDQHEYVDEILKGGRYLLTLINELLDIVRIESGKVQISIEPVQATGLILEAIDMVRPLTKAKNIKLINLLSSCEQEYMMADIQRCKQVFLNLLSNAIKYNRSDGTVTITCANREDKYLEFGFEDTGIGIRQEMLGRVFNPFDRLDAEQTGVEGTGLGLTLTKCLVEAMNGYITVESTHKIGSIFRVGFPKAISRGDVLPRKEALEHALPQVESHASILYVEDNPTNLKLVRTILSRRPNWKLISAMQGSLGIELAREHHPTCILLDLNLPDISGEEVLRQLHSHAETQAIPVIVLSADATPGQIERLKRAGVTDYLAKPLDVRMFLSTLDEIVESKSVASLNSKP